MFGSIVGGLLGSAASSGMQHLNNYISGLMNVGFQKELQDHAAAVNYEYSEKSAKNSPVWNRAGLESAGYNPMLAVQNATSGANSSWTSAGQYTQGNLSDTVTSGIANAQSFQRLENETSQAESFNDRNYAEADNLKTQSAINAAKLPYVSEREKKEIANVEAQSAKLENDIHYQNEMLNYYQNSLKLQEMGLQPQLINAGANATNAETNRKQYLIDKEVQDIVRDKQKRYKEWGQKHPYLRNIDETVSRYFNGVGANASRSTSIKR